MLKGPSIPVLSLYPKTGGTGVGWAAGSFQRSVRHLRTYGFIMMAVLGRGWLMRTNSQQVEKLSEKVSHFPAIAEQAPMSISASGSGATKSSFGKRIFSMHTQHISLGIIKIRRWCDLHTHVSDNGNTQNY